MGPTVGELSEEHQEHAVRAPGRYAPLVRPPSDDSVIHVLHVLHAHAQRQARDAKKVKRKPGELVRPVACSCDLCVTGRRWVEERERKAAGR